MYSHFTYTRVVSLQKTTWRLWLWMNFIIVRTRVTWVPGQAGADLGGGCRGCTPTPPPHPRWSAAFQYNWYSAKYADMYGVYSQQVNIMLLPSQKPSSSYSLLKFVYVTSQLHHPLEVYSLLRKILDSPLTRKPDTQVRKKVWPKTNKKVFPVPIFIFSWQNSHKWPFNHYSGYKGPENHSCKWPALFTHTFFVSWWGLLMRASTVFNIISVKGRKAMHIILPIFVCPLLHKSIGLVTLPQ